ncbi:MAG: Rieske 2Fe-2S domain-containing protein, partial [Chloroflexi bacterium]|nr:Rieske 2Fe-2S domain-containing protein [Chloroflexota bacterium]
MRAGSTISVTGSIADPPATGRPRALETASEGPRPVCSGLPSPRVERSGTTMALTIGIAPHTLPARWYTDPAIFERERDAIFGTSWQVACFSPDVAAPGSYATATLGDRPVVVVRDADGTPRAFYNVCQ